MTEKLIVIIGIILIVGAVIVSSPRVKSALQGRLRPPGFPASQQQISSPSPSPSSFSSLIAPTTAPQPQVSLPVTPSTGPDLLPQILIFSSSLSLGYFLLKKQ